MGREKRRDEALRTFELSQLIASFLHDTSDKSAFSHTLTYIARGSGKRLCSQKLANGEHGQARSSLGERVGDSEGYDHFLNDGVRGASVRYDGVVEVDGVVVGLDARTTFRWWSPFRKGR